MIGMGRQVLVGRDNGAVGQTTVLGPDIQQVVRGPGKVHFKLLGQGFGRRPMSAARVGREEEDAEGTALGLGEEGLGGGDFGRGSFAVVVGLRGGSLRLVQCAVAVSCSSLGVPVVDVMSRIRK